MKLLKIENKLGYFRAKNNSYVAVDEIDKRELLHLVNATLEHEDAEFDEYDVEKIANQAHQIVYESVFNKLSDLHERRDEFIDDSERLYLKEYERYREDSSE